MIWLLGPVNSAYSTESTSAGGDGAVISQASYLAGLSDVDRKTMLAVAARLVELREKGESPTAVCINATAWPGLGEFFGLTVRRSSAIDRGRAILMCESKREWLWPV